MVVRISVLIATSNTGYVLNATIDRYAYCTIETCEDNLVAFNASDQQKSLSLSMDEYPFDLDGDLLLLKATYNKMIKEFNNNKPLPLKIVTYCDSPVGSGLGTSSSLVVSIIKSL